MTRPFPRALLFAVLAVIVWAIVSAIAVLVVLGIPKPDEVAAFQRAAAGEIRSIDMIVGGIVTFVFGFLTARPFAGRAALAAAATFGLIYLLLEVGGSVLLSGTATLDFAQSLPAFGIKLGAALLGGLLASRRGEVASDRP